MTKDRKVLIFVVLIAIFTNVLTIFFYEKDIDEYTNGMIVRKEYKPEEVCNMIKKLPDYQGDSIIINEEGLLKSQDNLIQSVIQQMYIVPANFESIRSIAKSEGVPEPFVVYRLAIHYYTLQYGTKRTKDSTTVLSPAK
jgi:hypothetical protein